jgi:hypothetical protein
MQYRSGGGGVMAMTSMRVPTADLGVLEQAAAPGRWGDALSLYANM